jgi:small-conductance mechanosensitive channel
VNKDDRIYEVVASHATRRSIASIVGIALGIFGILLAVLVWLGQGFNPLAFGYGLLLLGVSMAMK